jgi:hypothetical protein
LEETKGGGKEGKNKSGTNNTIHNAENCWTIQGRGNGEEE